MSVKSLTHDAKSLDALRLSRTPYPPRSFLQALRHASPSSDEEDAPIVIVIAEADGAAGRSAHDPIVIEEEAWARDDVLSPPSSPVYQARSPVYDDARAHSTDSEEEEDDARMRMPAYRPMSPTYSATSPVYRAATPVDSDDDDARMRMPAYRPMSPTYSATSPVYRAVNSDDEDEFDPEAVFAREVDWYARDAACKAARSAASSPLDGLSQKEIDAAVSAFDSAMRDIDSSGHGSPTDSTAGNASSSASPLLQLSEEDMDEIAAALSAACAPVPRPAPAVEPRTRHARATKTKAIALITNVTSSKRRKPSTE